MGMEPKKIICFCPLEKKVNEDVKFCDINDYYVPNLFDGIDEEAMALARRISKFRGDETFQDMLTYDGSFNLFEFVKFEFVYEFLEDVIRKIKLVKRTIESEDPDEIIIEGKQDQFEKIVRSVAKSEDIVVRTLIKSGSFEETLNNAGKRFKSIARGFLRSLRRTKRRYLGKVRLLLEKRTTVSKNKKVLFVLYSRNHVNTTMPIIKELKTSGKEVKIIGLNVGSDQKKFQRLKEEKQPFTNLEAYITRGISSKAKKSKREFSKQWRSLKNDPRFKEQLEYDNVSIWEIAKDKFEYFFSIHFVDIVRYIETMKHVCEIEQPDIIIISELGLIPIGKAAIEVGNLKDVLTLGIQQGFWPDIALFETISSDEDPIPPKRIAVYGDFTKRVLVKRGGNAEKIVVTGDPKLDNLAKADVLYNRDEVCDILKIDSRKHVLVLATNPIGGRDNEELLKGVFAAIKDVPNAQLVVKPHPAEDESFHKGIAKQMGMSKVIITKDIDLHALLYACDVLLVVHSTVALEAMRLEKPVISINLTNIVNHINYAGSGAAIGVSRQEDIAPAIMKVLEDKTARNELVERERNYVFDQLYKNDGKATKRVVGLIEAMLE